MAIDLSIPGEPAGIYGLADWIEKNISVRANALRARLERTSSESWEFWAGRTGDAFRDSVTAIANGVNPLDNYASDASDVFRAYARRLERGREEFDGYLAEAVASVLIVSGKTVAMPMPPKTYVTAPGQLPPVEHGPNGESIYPMTREDFDRAAQLYAEIAENVGTWWGELENWINEHMVPLMARATDFDMLAKVFQTLKLGNEVVRGFPLALAELTWSESLLQFEEAAKASQEDAKSHSQRLRSGDPAVRAAAEAISKTDLNHASSDLARLVERLKVGTKIVIPGSNIVIDVVASSAEVANGGSWSSEVVGILGGIGGGAGASLGVSLLLAAASPVVVLAAGAVAVSLAAVAVGQVVKNVYEGNVPLDVREAIDSGDFEYVFR